MKQTIINVCIASLLALCGCKPNVDNLPDVYGKSSSYYISKNKKHIYALNHNPISGFTYKEVKADTKNFIVLGYSYGKDTKHVFNGNVLITGADYPNNIPIDVASFYVDDQGFPMDKNHVYERYGTGKTLTIIRGADPNAFDGMNGENYLTRDGKHYFYFRYMLEIADYDSFVFMSGSPDYGKDKYHVYFIKTENQYPYDLDGGAYIIKNADPNTFEVIEIFDGHADVSWAKDNKHYYYYGIQSDIDYDSFQVLRDRYVIDKNHVYRNGKIVDKTISEIKAQLRQKYGTEYYDDKYKDETK
jgi:hypothetical protein